MHVLDCSDGAGQRQGVRQERPYGKLDLGGQVARSARRQRSVNVGMIVPGIVPADAGVSHMIQRGMEAHRTSGAQKKVKDR